MLAGSLGTRKVKTSWIYFNEERDDGVAVASKGGVYAHHLHLAPDR